MECDRSDMDVPDVSGSPAIVVGEKDIETFHGAYESKGAGNKELSGIHVRSSRDQASCQRTALLAILYAYLRVDRKSCTMGEARHNASLDPLHASGPTQGYLMIFNIE